MNEMEHWNEINFILSEKIKPDITEAEFEKHVTEALRILGWSEYKGDLSVRPSFNIGAVNRITPDFLIKSGTQYLFAVEIKQPSIPLRSRFADQLTSYLRFLKLEIGIIIGEKIQLFYDDKSSDGNEAFIFEEIEFARDNPKGKEFTDLFSKDGFNLERIVEKARKNRAELEQQKATQKLKAELLSSEMEEKLKNLLKRDLQKDYPESMVDIAVSELSIYIQDKSVPTQPEAPQFFAKQRIKKTFTPSHYTGNVKIGEYVRTTFAEVMDKIDRAELENLQRQDYSKTTFDLQFPFLRRVLPTDSKKPLRYWKNPVQLFGEWYYMCSEWYETPANNDRPYYEEWLRKMRKKGQPET